MDEVEYRQIEGFPNYRIGNDGSVWRRTKRGDWLPIRGSLTEKGYQRVTLFCDGRPRWLKVHRLVLLAFVGPCPPNCETRHLDGVRTNNKLSNLAWGTAKENADDRDKDGVKNGSVKLTPSQVVEIRQLLASGARHKDIATRFAVSASAIGSISTRKTWSSV